MSEGAWSWQDAIGQVASIGGGFYAADQARRAADRQRGATFDLAWQMATEERQFWRERWGAQQEENRWAHSAMVGENKRQWAAQQKEARYWADHGKSREVAALRRAGLNPLLATGAFNSSSRGVAMSGKSSAPVGGVPSKSTSGGGSMQSAKLNYRFAQDLAAVRLLSEQAKKLRSETAINKAVEAGQQIRNRISFTENTARIIRLREEQERHKFRNTWVYKKMIMPMKDWSAAFGKPGVTAGRSEKRGAYLEAGGH